MSPETIVIGGEIAGAWQIIGPLIREKVQSRYILPSRINLNIRPASVQRPSLFGAIPIALQHCFHPAQRFDALKRAVTPRIKLPAKVAGR